MFLVDFLIQDALALVRLDDLYLESFEVSDGKLIVLYHLWQMTFSYCDTHIM